MAMALGVAIGAPSGLRADRCNAVKLQGSCCPGRLQLQSGIGLVNRRMAAAPRMRRFAVNAEVFILEAPGKDLEKVDMTAFVKKSIPGGIAAQEILATGRRKRAIARVCLVEGTGEYVINNRRAQEYLQGYPLWTMHLKTPFRALGLEGKYDVIAKAHGGGLSGQAQAIRLGISRCLLKINPDNRPPLRKAGFLTRDPRRVERKKTGLRKARKARQFSKR